METSSSADGCVATPSWPSRPKGEEVSFYSFEADGFAAAQFQRWASGNHHALINELKQRARQLKAETFALYLAARHPDTPWYAKLLVAAIVAYAFSPIDLIPDFIPIVGYLDDLVLVPIGIALAIKLVPPLVLADCRARAQDVMVNGKPVSRVAGAVIVIIWLALAALCIVWAYEAFAKSQ